MLYNNDVMYFPRTIPYYLLKIKKGQWYLGYLPHFH